MSGGKNRQPLGYTIIEVMIVLAVSGFMFVIATQFISGKQERTSFTDGVNQMASQLQDVIEQVTDGRYSDVQLSCVASVGGTIATVASSGSVDASGTNPQCVFVGKVLRFLPNQSTYSVIPLAGGRINPATISTDTSGIGAINDEHPAAIGPGVSGNSLTVDQSIPQGLTLKKLTITQGANNYSPDAGHNYYFGFVQGAGDVSSGSFQGGSSTISLIYIPVSGSFRANDTSIGTTSLAQADSVTLCVTDGTQFANLSMGTAGSGANLNVAVDRQVAVC